MKLAEGIEGQLTHHSHTAFKLQGRKGEGEVYVVFGLDSAGSVVRATVESPKAEDVTFEYTTKLFLEDLDRRHEARKARFEQLRKRLEELEKKYD